MAVASGRMMAGADNRPRKGRFGWRSNGGPNRLCSGASMAGIGAGWGGKGSSDAGTGAGAGAGAGADADLDTVGGTEGEKGRGGGG